MSFTQNFEAAGVSGAQGTVITAAASPNTLGAYTQLIASTGFAYQGFTVFIHQSTPTTGHEKFLLYIATGPATEVNLLPPLMFSMRGNGLEGPMIAYFPVAVAAGTRLSAAVQCTTASGSVRVIVHGNQTNVDGDNASYWARATTYGFDTVTSGGQAVDAGATVNTEGAYKEMTASCTNAVDALYLMVAVNTAAKAYAGSTDHFLVDIATGADLSETVVVGDIPIGAGDTNGAYYRPWIMGPYRVTQIPAGTRLAVRAKSTTNNAGDRVFHASLLALDQITDPALGGGLLALYLDNPVSAGASAGTLALSAPAASTSTTGWTVGTT